jgi:membrane-associated protease RseP (regulator of RpoE activity)
MSSGDGSDEPPGRDRPSESGPTPSVDDDAGFEFGTEIERRGDADGTAPPEDRLAAVFDVRERRVDGDRVFYYGESLVPRRMLIREVWPAFRAAGYEVQVVRSGPRGEVLVAEPTSTGVDGVPWVNLAMLLATVLTTLFVGATAWYYVDVSTVVENPLVMLRAWPFSAAVLGVLLTHELGHYLVGRYHGVDVSLPYVIPFIVPFGTMGAVIRMRGQMPDRRALFDIGVAGPIAGLVATVVVTIVGLSLRPRQVPAGVLDGSGQTIVFHNPPLMELIASLIGRPISYSPPDPAWTAEAGGLPLNPLGALLLDVVGHPVVIDAPGLTVHPVILGAWIGMFFTVLNLLPVGQLDGGHMLRAMVGRRQETVAALIPLVLFGLAAYLYYGLGLGLNESVGLWAFWGLFSTFIAYNGSADPVDETPIGWRRQALGVVTFLLGALCFIVVPVQLIGA